MNDFNFEVACKKFFSLIGALIILFGLSLGGYLLTKAIRSTGEIDYCYTEYYSPSQLPPVVQLFGFREYRSDRLIGTYKNDAEALDIAQKMGCRIGTKK